MGCRTVRAWGRGLAIAPLAVLASLTLAACSSLNPVNLLRDVAGTSANDPPEDAPNGKNLEAGGNRDFPNLASVPPAPTRALSTEEREALTQHLSADRANAKYIDEQLRVGPSAPVAPPPRVVASAPATKPAQVAPPPSSPAPVPPSPAAALPSAPAAPPPVEAAAAPEAPRESTLTSPEVSSTPQPEAPRPAPPPPPSDLTPGAALAGRVASAPPPPPPPPAPPAAASAPPPAQLAARPPAAPAAEAAAEPVAQITFADNSARLSVADQRVLGAVVPLQRRSGSGVRVVGYAAKPRGDGVTQQLASFKMALERANAVAAALTKAGVAPDQIFVEAAPPTGESGAAAQRAEIFLEN